MKKLILNGLEIHEYRVYSHLQMNRLGGVNLFVGKNNIGKSSVLEALWIYSQRGQPSSLVEILQSRDELSRPLPF
jgi:AAA15 family ATPase/GTPase